MASTNHPNLESSASLLTIDDSMFHQRINQVILDSIDNAELFLDSNYEVILANQVINKLLCTSIENLVGINIRDNQTQSFSKPLCHVILGSIYSKITNCSTPQLPIKWIKSIYDNKTVSNQYYQIKATPVFDNSNLLGFSVSISDISQDVISKSSLRIRKSFNKGVLNISRDPIITFDSNFSILGMNSCACRIFNDRDISYIGKRLEDIIQIKNTNTNTNYILDALAKQHNNDYLEINVIDRHGKEFYYEIFAGEVILASHTFYTAIFHDCSTRKLEENQLQHALSQANQQNEAKSSFLAVMSHEMRTPLIGILGIHEILQDTDLNEEQARYLQIATASSNSLLHLINGILDFSKIEAGKLELEMLDFNPEDTVNQVVEMLATAAYKKNISLQTYIDPNLPTRIVSDPVRLHQVLVNIINNAIKFTENGGISVKAQASKTNHNQIIFEIKDTGIGIPAHKLSTLFDDFTQVDSSTHRRYGGTGLGLAISNRLVNLLGGKLELESQPDLGSKFSFTVQSADTFEQQTYQPPAGLKGLKILLVDSSKMSSSILIRQLENFSILVDHVSSLEHGFERLTRKHVEKAQYDIAIVNLFKLEGNLKLFCSSLEQLKTNTCKFILIGHPDNIRQIKSTHESVFNSAIPLPIRRTTLLQRIKLLIEKGSDDYKPIEETVNQINRQLNNICILIVDDSQTNRIVTQSMLDQAGYTTLTATNGKEAISTLQQKSIDLVLMDLSMPVMDGIQATIYIRTLPGFQTLPIIALTATALQEEIDACYHAGMNDYLGKPFTKQTLFDKLTEWTANDSQSDDIEKSEDLLNPVNAINSSLSDDDSALYIDAQVLSQMSNDLPPELLPEMIELFLEESTKRMQHIDQLIISKDMTEMGNQAHALKGSAATFGAVLLVPVAQQLELACKQGDIENAYALADQVLKIGNNTIQAYKNQFKKSENNTR